MGSSDPIIPFRAGCTPPSLPALYERGGNRVRKREQWLVIGAGIILVVIGIVGRLAIE